MSASSSQLPETVHPRARGERVAEGKRIDQRHGSSPRTRGTHFGERREIHEWRFIPAHAGNASSSRLFQSSSMVHPRARGERSINPVTGVIPDQVHPRARGERSSIGNGLSNIAGSSPRTRGTPRAFIASTASGRFIPAHAGNAGMSGSTPGGSSVHPRARGERTEGGGIMGKVYGSSPRTRGTPLCNMWLIGGSRFIPAHAGNATGWARRGRSWPVHPRARGERLTVPIFPEGRAVHPRARGERS